MNTRKYYIILKKVQYSHTLLLTYKEIILILNSNSTRISYKLIYEINLKEQL